jgi:hypothetical protein
MNEKQIINYLINKIKEDYGIKTSKEARELLFNAISYNVVVDSILSQIDYLLNKESN